MKKLNKLITSLSLLALTAAPIHHVKADCTYVTDAGGYAYDECRAVTNLAPAIALSTVIIVAIIAVAVQNSHDSSSSSSTSHCHCGHFNSSSCSSSSSSSSCSSF